MPADGTLTVQAAFIDASEAVDEIARGRFLVVADGERPDSEADVMIAADFADADAINFLVSEARGVIYLGLSDERCRELDLPPMTEAADPDDWRSAFTVMIEAREGVTTGISAHDRARTVAAAIDPSSGSEDLVQPGHVAPLRARAGGVLARAGRTECFVDLPGMAGLTPAAVASSILRDDGAVARVADLEPWCRRHDIRMVSVGAVAAEAVRRVPWLERREERRLATPRGEATAVVFVEPHSGDQHIAVVGAGLAADRPPRVAVYGQCVTGHALGDRDCTERPRLGDAVAAVAAGELDALVHVGVGGLCCRDRALPVAPEDPGALASRPWPLVAKILFELGAESAIPWSGPPRDWSALKEYGLCLAAEKGESPHFDDPGGNRVG